MWGQLTQLANQVVEQANSVVEQAAEIVEDSGLDLVRPQLVPWCWARWWRYISPLANGHLLKLECPDTSFGPASAAAESCQAASRVARQQSRGGRAGAACDELVALHLP